MQCSPETTELADISGFSSSRINIWPECQILEDPNNAISIKDLLQDSSRLQFKSTYGVSSMFGFTASSYWIRFKHVEQAHYAKHYLTIERVSLWEADLYLVDSIGNIHVKHLGVNTPYRDRAFQSKFAICELTYTREEWYYLKVSAVTSLFLPIFIDSTQSLTTRLAAIELMNGIYIGVFLIIILYNFLAFLLKRHSIYGSYLFYVFCLFVYQGLFNTGLGFEFLWPDWPSINRYYVVSSSLFGISMIIFSAKFLEVGNDQSKFYNLLKVLVVAFTSIIGMCLAGFYYLSSKFVFWVLLPTFVSLFILGVVSIKKGNINARLYLAGWGVLLFFYFIFALWLNGYVGESVLGHRALLLGSFFEMIFWFSAVSDKVNVSRRAQQRQEIMLRKEVARDFHDELGNQAARLINYVGLLRMRGSLAPDVYESLSVFATNILDGTKDFVWALDPSNDNLTNTIIHLKDFGEQLFAEKNISFRFYKEGDDHIRLPYGHSRQINLIFKEAITNAFRHSEATAVEMLVSVTGESTSVSLSDNGKGIAKEIAQKSTRGLQNIRVRAKKIGATAEIMHLSRGTRLKLTIQQYGEPESNGMDRRGR